MEQDFNFTRGESKFVGANAPSQIHAIDECSQQDVGEHASGGDTLHRVLQLLPSESGSEENARDGGGYHRSRLVYRRVANYSRFTGVTQFLGN